MLLSRAALLAAELLTVQPRPTGSEWANTHGWIARSSGASEGGRYSTDRTPYMREILDVMCDEVHQDVVFNKPAQIGFTEAINQSIGYSMAVDPSGILVIQPNINLAKAWMKERIDPMLAENPALRGLIRSEGRRRSSDDTMQRKMFRGGWLVGVGANAPGDLRSRAARKVYGDERSGWTLDARNQGDPWGLSAERTETFWNAKRIQGSTPGERGTCPITAAVALSDRRRYHVVCPHCGHREPFSWRDPDKTYRIVCDRDAANQLIPETAHYLCRACGVLIPESEKMRMMDPARGAQWIPEHPGRPMAGFDMGNGGGLMSPWRSWARIMHLWLEAQRDPEKLKVFVTHVLGDPYYVERDRIEVHTLEARAEVLPTAPERAKALAISVDVQGDRVETLECAWAARMEGWVLQWEQHFGHPQESDTWERVFQHIASSSARWGVPLRGIAADTQYATDTVWSNLARWRERLRGVLVLGVRGEGGPGRALITPPPKDVTRRYPVWGVGTDTAKDVILGHALRVPIPPGGPGALHLNKSLDPVFYHQVTSESPMPVSWGGRTAMVWRKRDDKAANEGLDLIVYNLALITAAVTRFGLRLDDPPEAAPANATDDPPPPPDPGLVQVPPTIVPPAGPSRLTRPARPGQKPWATRW